MRVVIALILIVVAAGCNPSAKEDKQSEKSNTKNFDWLIGEWKRTNDKTGQETFEYWTKSSDNIYNGIGCTMQNTDTVFKEQLSILKTNNKWALKVSGVHDTPVFFQMTKIKTKQFTCSNDSNDFPKTIEYTLLGDSLFAIVSNDENEIKFTFTKTTAN